ncbi:MAG: hypothetical protein A3F72_20965 [Bacteroidetes bacterium RIFCSPLOWO2_12_FULL_35_15]|nr:MAG: hypothetical protein A3F72_20965 [Bacteroidetes bacterium RIFCSPLOWO2_12_FULL_35_15]
MSALNRNNIQDRLKLISKISALILGAIGTIVIAGWLLNIPLFKSILPNSISMKFNTAICFALSGIALGLLNKDKDSFLQKVFLFSCLFFILLLSSVNLYEHFFDKNTGIDELLMKDDLSLVETLYPGRMAPFTAIDFVLSVIAFLTLFLKLPNYKIANTIALFLFATSLFSICEYLYNVEVFANILFNTKMAIHTSIGFFALSIGLLTAQGEKGIIIFFTSDTIGGTIARRLIPLVIFLLLFFGWVQLQGEKLGWYEEAFGEALFSILNILILVIIILWNVNRLIFEETRRKTAEEKKMEAYARIRILSLAIEQSPVTTIITDLSGNIVYVNPTFTKTSGYTSEEATGKNPRILKTEFKTPLEYKEMWDTILSGQDWSGIFQNKKKNGALYWESAVISPVKNEAGLITHFLAVKEDITERKLADEKRKKDEQKLKEHAELLVSKNIQLTDFCNIVSHNLRGPMVNISMLIDFIENAKNEKERTEMLEKLKPVITNLNESFNELVESLQVRNDHELKSEKISLEDALQKILYGMEAEISMYDANIGIDITNAPVINFPAKYLKSILFNLINNSLKYRSPERKPIIKINTKKINDSIILSIADNGLGIDLKMHQKNLFKIRKVFHEHPDAKGFGLFMTKTQVEAMGGKIWVESTPDAGATFFIEFKDQNK